MSNMCDGQRRGALTLLGIATLVGLLPVASAAQAPAFEAASIRQNTSGSGDGIFRRSPGRFTVTNLSVGWIIQTAYGIREYQIVNAPSWTQQRYDVAATFAPSDASSDDVRLMLQRLLAERFSLGVHPEQRQLTVYEITEVRPSVLGPKIKASPQSDCATTLLAAPECRRFMTGFFIKGLWSITQLARSLEQVLALPVVDRTNLTGVFDIDLQWGTGSIGDPVSTLGVNEQAALLTAVREQLGLRLEPHRGPLEVLVIDHIERPSEN